MRKLGSPLLEPPKLEMVLEIQQRGLSVRVLALSAYDSDHYLAEMWEADACGYLLKEEPLERIAAAIQQVARGEPLWTTAQIQRIQRYREIEARWSQLTEREREVLKWMAQGLSNKEIAQTLGLTPRTVEFHAGNTLHKLGGLTAGGGALGQGAQVPSWIEGINRPVEIHRSEARNFHSRQRA